MIPISLTAWTCCVILYKRAIKHCTLLEKSFSSRHLLSVSSITCSNSLHFIIQTLQSILPCLGAMSLANQRSQLEKLLKGIISWSIKRA